MLVKISFKNMKRKLYVYFLYLAAAFTEKASTGSHLYFTALDGHS